MDPVTGNCAATPVINNGNVVQIKNNRNTDRTQGFTYDELNRIRSAETQANTGQYCWGQCFGENCGGSYISGYDIWANLKKITVMKCNPPMLDLSISNLNRILNPGFSYDAARNLLSDGSYSYTYDNLSRLLSVLHQAGMSTIDGATYTVDAAGNRTSKGNALTSLMENYTYDAIYQLTQVVQGATTTENYTYDPVGNRLSSLGVSPYNYNVSNELTATPNATYTYDANGNTLSKTDSTGTTTYSWDFEDRLTSVTLSAGGTVTFKYDPYGRRIYRSSISGISVFVYDGDNLVEETNAAGGVVARYSQALNIDEPLAMLRSGATSYYNADGLGSITSVSNVAGALAQTYTFDSFGKQTNSAGSLINPFQYTGREFDSETGLYFYRARYYDPASGRFISEDSLRWRGGTDFYRYTRNNPIDFRDPSGKLSIAAGFSRECLADVLNAMKILKDRIKTVPKCECWFLSQGLHAPLSLFLDNPLYVLKYDPRGNESRQEQDTLAYVNPGDPYDIFLTPKGCNSGPVHIAQDIVHEFAHITLGHWGSWYQQLSPREEAREHNKARLAENACGFAIQVQGTSITVTP
jgi:RHS repeat-associated protein